MAIRDFIDAYQRVSGDGRKTSLLDEIACLLPNTAGLDFLVQIAAGDSIEDEVPRLHAIDLLRSARLETAQDKEKIIACLIRKLKTTRDIFERINAVDAIARFLDDDTVRSLLHGILLDIDENVQVRKTAIVCIMRHPPTTSTIEVCRQLLSDSNPVLARSAERRLQEWGQL